MGNQAKEIHALDPRIPEKITDIPSRDYWVGRNLRRATNAIFQNFSTHFSEFQIRPSLFAALHAIETNPGSSGAELSELMQLPRTNMVLILRELEKRKLIDRRLGEKERRAHSIYLSSLGEGLMPELHKAHLAHTRDVYSLMEPEEREQLMAVLRKLWQSSPNLGDANTLDD